MAQLRCQISVEEEKPGRAPALLRMHKSPEPNHSVDLSDSPDAARRTSARLSHGTRNLEFFRLFPPPSPLIAFISPIAAMIGVKMTRVGDLP